MYDFLIVGAGLTGATLARELTDRGRACLVVDKRDHIAGNCHTPKVSGRLIHAYGPHYFHTNMDSVWEWVNRYADWRHYVPRVKARVGDDIYSLPINLATLHRLWGVTSPANAKAALRLRSVPARGDNAEAHMLRTVGRELYELFFRGYTTKQWGITPDQLPASIVSRVPVRMSFDDSYHVAKHQAVPTRGYTDFIATLLRGVDIELESEWKPGDTRATFTIYTGPVDALFGHDGGRLEYRSLRFDHTAMECDDFQGCAQVNYPAESVPFTRIIEHNHIHPSDESGTVITREYPLSDGEPCYPVMTGRNVSLATAYRQRAREAGIITAGRLGTYRYMDMDAAIISAFRLARRLA